MENVSFGSGQKFDGNGFDVEGTALRQQLNDKLTGGQKISFSTAGRTTGCLTRIKFPTNRRTRRSRYFSPTAVRRSSSKNAAEMKTFYEGEMGVKWPYP